VDEVDELEIGYRLHPDFGVSAWPRKRREQFVIMVFAI